jgi:hypothetical protein
MLEKDELREIDLVADGVDLEAIKDGEAGGSLVAPKPLLDLSSGRGAHKCIAGIVENGIAKQREPDAVQSLQCLGSKLEVLRFFGCRVFFKFSAESERTGRGST